MTKRILSHAAVERHHLESKLLHQRSQRIQSVHRIVVQLRGAAFEGDPALLETRGQHLATKSRRRLEDGDRDAVVELFGEKPCGEQPAWTASNIPMRLMT